MNSFSEATTNITKPTNITDFLWQKNILQLLHKASMWFNGVSKGAVHCPKTKWFMSILLFSPNFFPRSHSASCLSLIGEIKNWMMIRPSLGIRIGPCSSEPEFLDWDAVLQWMQTLNWEWNSTDDWTCAQEQFLLAQVKGMIVSVFSRCAQQHTVLTCWSAMWR